VIVVDTGVAYGAADRDDPDRPGSAAVLTDHAGQLVIPTPVIVESSWLIADRLGPAAEASFLRSVNAGELRRVDLGRDRLDGTCPGRESGKLGPDPPCWRTALHATDRSAERFELTITDAFF
jgi:predicted nucleic acid-binding protein